MTIEYWVYDKDWRKTNAKEYYNFNGNKFTCAENGFGFCMALALIGSAVAEKKAR